MDPEMKISQKQAVDTGMAMVLILLIGGLFTGKLIWFKITVLLLVINMIFPKAYLPVAFVWIRFSRFLGTIMSKIILTIVFFILVLPVGIIRRLSGKDTLQLKSFKAGKESVMKIRNHIFEPGDLERPF